MTQCLAQSTRDTDEMLIKLAEAVTACRRPSCCTVPPVSDSPFPKEAFSIGEEEEEEEQRQGVPDEENTAEGPFQVEHPFQVEDMDECAVYQDSLCPQRCVNTPGSFRCECFAGFSLQQDNTCKPGMTRTYDMTYLYL